MSGDTTEILGPTKIVLGDANVLYPRVLRDYLVYAADEGAISIRWSRAILDEAVKHLQAKRELGTLSLFFEFVIARYEGAIERVEFDEDAERLVAHVRPIKRERDRCGVCRRRSPGYDAGPGRRRWRALDLGTIRALLEGDAPRVRCRVHGVVVAAVPWTRHDAGHTHAFDDQVAWLATQSSKSTVTELMRIAWRTVGRSSPGSGPTSTASMTGSPDCDGSGSTRSVTRRATNTSWCRRTTSYVGRGTT